MEFIGMDRGSCIMQAEVNKQDSDTVMLMESEESITLYRKNNEWRQNKYTQKKQSQLD